MNNHTRSGIVATAVSGLSLFFVGMACNSSSDDPDACYDNICPVGAHLYSCYTFETEYGCFDTYQAAYSWCQTNGSTDSFAPIPCSGNLQGETGETGGGGVSPYDPSSYVTYNSSTQEYEIDESFVDAMIENQFVQIATDGARFELQTSGYYKIVNVRSGDLMDELGLQSNDVLKSIDGNDLGTFEDQVDAYLNLKDETELSLTIERGTSTLVLDYKIVP